MSRRRQQRARQLPELALGARIGEVAGEREHAREHALDVAVEDRDALAEAERGDRRGGRAADAGQLGERGAGARELAAVLGDDDLGAAMEVARAAVVAEAAPRREHVARLGRRQRAHVAEARDEALVVRAHGRDLGLLQHDLREPDAVRVARPLPRQGVAAVLLLPGDEVLGEMLGKVARLAHPASLPRTRIKPGAAPSPRPAPRPRTAAGRA